MTVYSCYPGTWATEAAETKCLLLFAEVSLEIKTNKHMIAILERFVSSRKEWERRQNVSMSVLKAILGAGQRAL